MLLARARRTRASTPSVLGAQFSALSVQAGAAGTYPYSATVMPVPGQVPSGSRIGSADDALMQSSVIATHSDGSAAVVVVAGQITVTLNQAKTLALNTATGSAASALTTAAISALVSNVSVAFGSPYGTASISSFGSPEKTWWANSQVICARYRVAAPTPGSTALEAVIDIHAYSGRAFVEVVVENSKMDSASPVKPAAATYSGAVASVNGTTIATVSSPATSGGMYDGTHEAFRAWYASGWVGGDPGLEITHDPAYLQQHPLLFKCDQTSNQDMSAMYGSFAYTPWAKVGLNVPNMAGFGDNEMIGALPRVDSHYVQTGSRFARRGVIANARAAFGCNVNYRDIGGAIPTFTQTSGRHRVDSTWPETATEPSWEVPHHPAAGLMAFLCSPSPSFIELAQKVSVWNMTWTRNDATVDKDFATRGIAWGLRSLGHSIFLTPTGDAWKAPAQACMARNVTRVDQFRTDTTNTLGVVYAGFPDYAYIDERSGVTGFQCTVWFHYWLGGELHKLAQTGGMTTGQAALDTLADWACALPCRIINESRGGEWRYQAVVTPTGSTDITAANGFLIGSTGPSYAGNAGVTAGMAATWGAQFAAGYGSTSPALSGPWKVTGLSHPPATDYTDTGNENTGWATAVNDNTQTYTSGDFNYIEHFWAGLCYAVERGVVGSAEAWSTVNANVTNLSTWRTWFQVEPRNGIYPRANVSLPAWRSAMTALTWAKVGAVMNTVNPLNNAALNPLGSGTVGTWQNIGAHATEGFVAIVDDWSGAVYNKQRLYVHGGGHNGYAGNEVISIDLSASSPVWRIERPPTGWKTSASEGITLDDANETAKAYSNGDPRSSHTYDSIAWGNGGMYVVPSAVFSNPGNEVASVYKIFKFTPGAAPTVGNNSSFGAWSLVATLPAGTLGVTWFSGSLVYDPTRNCLYANPGQLRPIQRWDLTNSAWLTQSPSLSVDADHRGIYIPSLDLVVYLNYFPSGNFAVYKPSTNTVFTPGSTGTAPSPTRSGTGSSVLEYWATGNWVPELRAIVTWVQGGTGFHVLTPPAAPNDPTTTAWTWSRLEASVSNAVTPDPRAGNGDYGRFFYSPELRCLGVVSAANSGVNQFGLSNSGQVNIFALS